MIIINIDKTHVLKFKVKKHLSLNLLNYIVLYIVKAKQTKMIF